MLAYTIGIYIDVPEQLTSLFVLVAVFTRKHHLFDLWVGAQFAHAQNKRRAGERIWALFARLQQV